ncbi:DUF6930 domain-containing protein [Geminocystis herdmanii]|uniref:DUF6930 domain-containing protein n=1 Tax=Geminocystis herdmanii TaxID=669359 RepID=UPI00034638A0|nr:hypothetical protein [Geminocystis herdmanii]
MYNVECKNILFSPDIELLYKPMTSLPESTKHRLQRIPQIPHVWEGDRLPILGMMENLEPELASDGECIIWVDGSEGFVRSMEVTRNTTGPEAIVRALLKAIESPHNPATPARPQKIVVKDRELQFFLRGVLRDLDIIVDYQPELPLLDELWQNFQSIRPDLETKIAPELSGALIEEALNSIWEEQPWYILSEEEIITIEINHWGIENLYACVMGMLGQEFGVVLYRSIESLKSFRQRVLDLGESPDDEDLEATFLQQDCWFINFSQGENEKKTTDWDEFLESDVTPIFGSIHPYEGIRPLKEEEEVYPIYIAMKALGRFIEECEEELAEDDVEELISREYTLETPLEDSWLTVTVKTMPELTTEFRDMFEDDDDDYDDDDDDDDDGIRDDLIPAGTLVSLARIEQDIFLNYLYNKSLKNMPPEIFEKIKNKSKKDFLPVILLQTTRPKAQVIIERLKDEDGVLQITFNEGYDPYDDEEYTLGILKTQEENLYIFAQFLVEKGDSFPKRLQQWQKDVSKFHGYCGIVIAMGATGSSRGEPQRKDLLYLFYGELVDCKKLGLEKLVLQIEE